VPFDEDEEEEDELREAEPDEDAAFPVAPLVAASALFLLHFGIVLFAVGASPSIHRLAALGGLVTGGTLRQPFRLVTSLFLHADPSHALWNGVSMLAFAVPLIVRQGYLRTSAIYLAAGIAGCLASLATTTAGTVTIGSSGAVAGLFGAWVADALLRAREHPMSRRARIRTAGIALLVLPSLLQPATPSGDAISVASHLGGLAVGLALGWISGRSCPPRSR
jgi:membrane associated rhomboid family serine protease